MEAGRFNRLFAILHSGSVVLCTDRSEWVAWMKEAHAAGNLIIAQDSIEGFQVATIFLGTNLNSSGTGPPLWFETLVSRESANGDLGKKIEYGTVRYSTDPEARAGHVVVCEKVKGGEIGE